MSENKQTGGPGNGQSISSQHIAEIREELGRVLEASRKIMETAEATIKAETGFLQPHRAAMIDIKVDTWVNKHRSKLERAYPNRHDSNERYLKTIASNLKEQMRKDYLYAYKDLREHFITVNMLVQAQRQIHEGLEIMESLIPEGTTRLRRLLDYLRRKVSDSLLLGRVLDFKSNRLHREFQARLLDIDYEAIRWCRDKVRILIGDKEDS